ncbi:MAG: Gfo/Idh/MocA family oxidoreductase [Armatimonadetes bacterium]|nr:Gfo/Idh/MocA family oxidoreductase [Armatimonadota bacterium]
MDSQQSRRDFLKTTAGGMAAIGLPYFVGSRAWGANDRLGVGLIGVGGMGNGHLGWALGNRAVEVLAVCDVDAERRESAADRAGDGCAGYNDYRELLDRSDIDAVIISTPDHWHALQSAHACEAGKDVFCEKPLTLTISEGRHLANTVRRTERVLQTGSMQRSSWEFRLACELVRNGRIGKVHTVRVVIGGAPGGDYAPDEPPPPELDWDLWLGPAPWVPYNRLRHPYGFRWFFDYSGGKMTDWGAHHNDIAQWGLGMDHTGPEWIEGQGVFPTEGCYDVATAFEITYEYAGGQKVICSSEGRFGVTFEGEDGWVWVTRGDIETEPKELRDGVFGVADERLYFSPHHHEDWLNCIRTRERPICDVEIGHRSVTVCHLGNISMRTGRKLHWDPAVEQFIDDPDANRWLGHPYRAPWRL